MPKSSKKKNPTARKLAGLRWGKLTMRERCDTMEKVRAGKAKPRKARS